MDTTLKIKYSHKDIIEILEKDFAEQLANLGVNDDKIEVLINGVELNDNFYISIRNLENEDSTRS